MTSSTKAWSHRSSSVQGQMAPSHWYGKTQALVTLPAPSLVSPQLQPQPWCAWQVCGIVFFSSDAAEQLLATHVVPPLDACTYMGLDSGAPPIQVTAPLWGTGPFATQVSLLGISVGSVCPHTARFDWEGAPRSRVGFRMAEPNKSLLSLALPLLRHCAVHGRRDDRGRFCEGWW